MKLSYRGVTYKPHHTTAEVEAGAVDSHDRGLPWRIHRYQDQHRRTNAQSHELVYRGIHYEH